MIQYFSPIFWNLLLFWSRGKIDKGILKRLERVANSPSSSSLKNTFKEAPKLSGTGTSLSWRSSLKSHILGLKIRNLQISFAFHHIFNCHNLRGIRELPQRPNWFAPEKKIWSFETTSQRHVTEHSSQIPRKKNDVFRVLTVLSFTFVFVDWNPSNPPVFRSQPSSSAWLIAFCAQARGEVFRQILSSPLINPRPILSIAFFWDPSQFR